MRWGKLVATSGKSESELCSQRLFDVIQTTVSTAEPRMQTKRVAEKLRAQIHQVFGDILPPLFPAEAEVSGADALRGIGQSRLQARSGGSDAGRADSVKED